MFNQQLFEKHLSTSWLGRSFYYFEELASSNTQAKKIMGDSPLHGAVVLTDHQRGGRGQHQRKWETMPGENLTFSLIFEPKKNERFTLLTLACALAVSECINNEAQITTHLKWPNDILHKKKKLCGILTETQFSGNTLDKIIVGIGLNVNQQKYGQELSNVATSLALINSNEYSREKLLAEILLKIEYNYRLWNQHKPELVKQINHTLIGYGEWVKLQVNNQELDGDYKFLGVNEAGALVALNSLLDVQTFAFEQVRVREL
ncbi:MAG: biotin--[acetyl-CoA-carboxylase] ligase [Balneolaceae bacterium]